MRIAESIHLSRVAALQCCVCKRYGATGSKLAIHHVAEGSGKRSNFSVARLCEEHHVGVLGFHSGPRSFLARYRPPGESEYGLLVWTNEDLAERDIAVARGKV